MKSSTTASVLFWSSLAGAIAMFLWLVFDPLLPCIPLVTASAERVYLIPCPGLARLLGALCVIMPAGGFAAYRALRRAAPCSTWPPIAVPLTMLPCAFLGFLGLRVPVPVATNVAFFLPLMLLSWSVYRLWTQPGVWLEKLPTKWVAWGLFVMLSLLYGIAGYRISLRVGDHYVDEGHYIAQMASLREDGDLDLRNNLGVDVDEAIARELAARGVPPERLEAARADITGWMMDEFHISRNSPDGRWYSWHPWGLPVLLLPFFAMGSLMWHIGQGILAAVGCVVTYLLCLQCGNSKRSSLLMSLLMAVSTCWFTYSSRFLPETPGASVLVCAVFAAHLFASHPRWALALALAAGAYLPCLHIRFAPCAALAGGYFVLRVFTRHRDYTEAKLLLGLIVAGVVGTVGLLVARPELLKRALLYPTANVLFAYPEGAWLSLFSNRGLFYAFPLGVILVVALITAPLTDRSARGLHILAATTMAAILLTSGMADCWDGGPTLAGRYLVVVIPLAIPAAAHLFTRTGRWGKWWIIFLGLYSAAFFVVAMAQLQRLPRDFLHLPRYTFKYCLPLLRDLFAPYHISDIMVGHPYKHLEALTRQIFPLVFFAVTFLFVAVRPLRKSLICGLLVAFAAFCFQQHQAHNLATGGWEPAWIEQAWSANYTARGKAVDALHRRPYRLAQESNRFSSFSPIGLTQADLGDLRQEDLYSQPYIDPNGWEQKGYRWLTVCPPFRARKSGPRLFRIQGALQGEGAAYIAVRQGDQTLLYDRLVADGSNRFDQTAVLDYTESAATVEILARHEGTDGVLRFDAVHWTPISQYEKSQYP